MVLNEATKYNSARALEFSIAEKIIIMDKQLIQQFGTDILSYRLRSKRHKRRMQHKDLRNTC